jgi:hypothetical protein
LVKRIKKGGREQLSPLTLPTCPKIIRVLSELSKDILRTDTHPGKELLRK